VTGFDTALEAAAQVFSSPALPSLDNEGFSITPLYGTVTVSGQNETATIESGGQTSSIDISNEGELKGDVAGLSLNYSGKGDLGFFVFIAGSRVNGDMTTTTVGAALNTATKIRDISAQSTIETFGLNWRFIGDAKSKFAMGIFGGPAFVQSKTSATFDQADGTSTKVLLDPNLSALYLGLQMMFRLGEFRINPYLNLLASTSEKCEQPTYEGDPYPVGQYNRCQNGEKGVDTRAGIYGSGINAGYGRFQFGLISEGGGTNGAFKAKALMFSYRIGI
jgi:hypothetical protein